MPEDDMNDSTITARPRLDAWVTWVQWVLASTIGAPVGWMLGFLVYEPITGVIRWAATQVVLFALTGAVVGLAQWLVLKQQLRGVGWWILTGAVGWPLGFALGDALARSLFSDASVYVSGAATFAVVGAVTGGLQALLLWIKKTSRVGWWLAGSVVGWAAGWLVSLVALTFLGTPTSEMVGISLGFAITGFIAGMVSGFILQGILGKRNM
jgi:hypothetical protein